MKNKLKACWDRQGACMYNVKGGDGRWCKVFFPQQHSPITFDLCAKKEDMMKHEKDTDMIEQEKNTDTQHTATMIVNLCIMDLKKKA